MSYLLETTGKTETSIKYVFDNRLETTFFSSIDKEEICRIEKKRFVLSSAQTILLIKRTMQFNHTFNNVSRKFSKKAKIKCKTPDIGLLKGRRKRDLDRDLYFKIFFRSISGQPKEKKSLFRSYCSFSFSTFQQKNKFFW